MSPDPRLPGGGPPVLDQEVAMVPIKALIRALVPTIILLLASACGDDPTPTPSQTPTATSGPTATPTVTYFTTELVTPVPTRPRPTPTPTPTPAPAAGQVYVLDRISTPGCRYELRMGQTTAWGYGGPTDPDQRILAGADPQDGRDYKHIGGIEVGPLNVGDTLQFRRFENPSRICLETVSIVNEELGLSETLAPDERVEPFELTFTKAGRFVIDDPAKPGERGSFVFVVNE